MPHSGVLKVEGMLRAMLWDGALRADGKLNSENALGQCIEDRGYAPCIESRVYCALRSEGSCDQAVSCAQFKGLGGILREEDTLRAMLWDCLLGAEGKLCFEQCIFGRWIKDRGRAELG